MQLWSNKIALGSALVASTLAPLGFSANAAPAQVSIAYCNGEDYAINVLRTGDPAQPSAPLTLRIYARADRVTFLTTGARREPNPEGYNYSNLQGENQWTLFMPNSTSSACTLSRDGTVVDRGTVTRREPPSGD